jgi:hypothetical protein
MSIRYVTYATHEHGLFKQLINNKYGLEIEVLGWGEKWTGFMDKFKAVQRRIKDLPDDEIVCFLDGFDTLVNADPESVADIFKTKFKGAKIVVSNEMNTGPIRSYVIKNVFGRCVGEETLNSGMYIGYVSELKKALKYALRKDTTDDQRALNSVCHLLDIAIDTREKLFHNSPKVLTETRSSAIFVSYPGGSASWEDFFPRALRAVSDYSKFFVVEIASVLMLIFLIAFVSYQNS